MQISFIIEDLPPCPRNRSHMLTVAKGRPMLIKTQLTREFEKDLTLRLEEHKGEFLLFSKTFNPKEQYLKAEYIIYTPEEDLFTKDGRISSKSTDVDAHKVFQDVIFKCIGLDDKLIRDARYYTPVSKNGKYNYVVTFTACPIEHLKLQPDIPRH